MSVHRLLAETEREAQGFEIQWESVEDALGTRLPSDYKELCEAFGVGAFSKFLEILAVDEEGVSDIVAEWKHCARMAAGKSPQDSAYLFAPYPIYEPGAAGLIPWGNSEVGYVFFWLADGGDPNRWPILVQVPEKSPNEWLRFDMPTAEFVLKLVTDPGFGPFPVAQAFPQPFFEGIDELWK